MNELGNTPADKDYKPSGISKALEAAFKAYPYFPTEVNLFGHKTITTDGNSHYRGIYIKGYEQAEKDLALTWEDVENIVHIYEIAKDVVGDYDIELYEEVLARFKQIKGDKK